MNKLAKSNLILILIFCFFASTEIWATIYCIIKYKNCWPFHALQTLEKVVWPEFGKMRKKTKLEKIHFNKVRSSLELQIFYFLFFCFCFSLEVTALHDRGRLNVAQCLIDEGKFYKIICFYWDLTRIKGPILSNLIVTGQFYLKCI